jgi:POT family proton-dependent oligopeptide transporter
LPPQRLGGRFLGHPPGLAFLFLVEMWERFSYYGMRLLLVLYLTTPTTGVLSPPAGREAGFNPGRGWTDAEASTLYGWYTGLAYLVPVIGGIIADKLIGTHRSMLVGGTLIALGHVALGISGLGTLASSTTGMSLFVGGLALIIFGTGHFKPCVSVMVGELYAQGDPRRDSAFSIFYMGINIGALVCAFICGTLGELVGWHWGFGSAAVGMLLGMGVYLIARPLALKGIGEAPANASRAWPLVWLVIGVILAGLMGVVSHVGGFAAFYEHVNAFVETSPRVAFGLGVAAFVLCTLACAAFTLAQRRQDRGPVATIFIYMVFNAFFWIAFEQAGSSLNLFTDRNTDRVLYTTTDATGAQIATEVPTTWFQSVNSAFVILLAVPFAVMWPWLARRKLNPAQPVKIALGLIFLGIGYLFLVYGSHQSHSASQAAGALVKTSMFFIIATYFWHTVGEMCLSPTGLAYVTKAAPVRLVSLLMGLWFVASFLANLGGGLIAAQVKKVESGALKLPWNFGGQTDFFFLFVVTSFAAGLTILALSPLLIRLQRSRAD